MIDVTLRSIHRMTPRVKQFQLERTDGETFDFDPGQHTKVRFEEDGEEVVRPYTPTSRPGTGKLTLAIKRYDDGTASVYMHGRGRGDTITIEEPDGNLFLRDLDRDVVLLSSGTGITPMMAMLRQYLREGTGDVHFLFGEKRQEHLMYRETLDAYDAGNDRLSVVYSLSEEDWNGPTGHVQRHLDDVLDTFEGKHFYLCGVPGMVVETKDRLRDRGVPDDHVFSEGWEEDEVAETD